MFKRAILLTAVLLAGCAPAQTLYWVKSDGARLDRNQASLRQLAADRAVCEHRKTEIAASGVGSTEPLQTSKPTDVVSYSDDADVTDEFRKSDTIDKSIQARMIFDACMKDRGYRKSPTRMR